MTLHRRDLLKAGAAFSAGAALPRAAAAQTPDFTPQPGAWRRFEITTRLDIASAAGATQAWMPLPSVQADGWHQANGNVWRTNGEAVLHRDPKYGSEMLHVVFAAGEKAPFVEATSQIATRDRATDFNQPGDAPSLSAAERALYLESTDLIPTDGVVKETADRITAGAATDVEKARAIYEWVVENTFRNAATRGCGVGDIAAMLKSGNLGGKCADLNALYVGLARASGIPARDVYGVRVAPSKFGYKSLGAGSENITRAQHCRAEVFLAGLGWTPVDPADVRKVVLEEPATSLALGDPKVAAARKTLFGAWEGNWLAYNFAHDIALPGSSGPRLGFLMYPQAETANARLDCLDPDAFRYMIRSKELTAA
ncbi:transglutaminase domain-containing protein [Terrarubrum flagellatum]|uniref:transglutaminase-like domain-containing protein n=1 Tax=Terrirubrum flagellatum TaxID=2895980 RepID=UPI0031451915